MAEKGPWATLLLDTPFLRAQTILQTQDINPSLRFKPMKGLLNCFNRINMEEGFRYFWRSGSLCFIKAALHRVFEGACSLYSAMDTEVVIETHRIEFRPSEEGQDTEGSDEPMEKRPLIPEDKVISHEVIKQRIGPESGEENPFAFAGLPLSGFIIGWNLLFHPLEVLRVRYACDYGGKTSRYTGVIDTARHLGKSEGIKAFYRGYIPMTFSFLLQRNLFMLVNRDEKMRDYTFVTWLGLDFLMYPLTVVGHRLMMQADNPLVRYEGMRDCAARLYKDSGLFGFYRGYQVNLVLYSIPIILYTIITKQLPSI